MITVFHVNIKQLLSALTEADTFKLPTMTAGTAYLYHNLYERLSQGKEIRLSSLDMNAFDHEDITTLKDLYAYVFEANHHTALALKTTLRQIRPTNEAVGYI
jgi:hypothetical protein